MDGLNHFPQMMQNQLLARVRQTEAEACARKAGVRTRQQAEAYRDEVRRKLRKVFGPLPRRTPLNPRLTGTLEREGYRVEKLLFESRPGLLVSANLYVPERLRGKAPGVLVPCGHAGDGKAFEDYQTVCQNLVRVGCVVLTYDPLSQGERVQHPDAAGQSRIGGCCNEHNMMGKQLALLGDFMGTWRVWDGIRATDYLASRPEVDATRLGVTGNSGGGTLTTWMIANDRRFAVAAPGCYIATWRRNAENELPADAEQQPPHALELGLDMDDFLAANAPRPLLLLTKELDFFDQRGAEEAYERLRRLYRVMGAEDAVRIFTGPGGHGYSRDQREAMVRFFGEALGLDTGGYKEPTITLEAEKDLWASPEGNVVSAGSRWVSDFIAEEARALEGKRARVEAADLGKALGAALKLPRRGPAPDYRILPLVGSGGRWPKEHSPVYAVPTEPGIEALVYAPGAPTLMSRPHPGRRAALYVSNQSADLDLERDPLARRLCEGKDQLFTVDCRGTGESRPDTCGPDSYLSAYGSDYFYASYQVMYGEPYLGRRVHDVAVVLDWLGAAGCEEVHLAGSGWGAVVAALAGALCERVTKVTLRHAPLSLTDWCLQPDCAWPAALCADGILRKLDLPDVYRALAQGKGLKLEEPLDGEMRPLGAEAAKARLKALGVPAKVLGK